MVMVFVLTGGPDGCVGGLLPHPAAPASVSTQTTRALQRNIASF
jgi:hypothetical protein